MDGVISDIYDQFLKYEFENLGIKQDTNSKNFFYKTPPIEHSIDALKEINAKYEPFIVSSAIQFPSSIWGR